MRQAQQSKRMRGRSRKGPNPLTRSYESNGPDVKIRGTALHIAEKYVQLARDAQSAGDRVQAENYLQHAEHYYRIVSAAQAQMPQPQQFYRSDAEPDEEEDRAPTGIGPGDRQPHRPDDQPSFRPSDPQPYINGNGEDRDEGPIAVEPAEDAEPGDRPEPQREAQSQPESGQREAGRPDNGHGYRSRRRRPYRGGERGPGRSGGGEPPPAAAPEGAAAASED